MAAGPVCIGMTDPPEGAVALLADAIRYALGVCTLIAPGDLTLPTPCAEWDLSTLLGHLSVSMADLEEAMRTGYLTLRPQPPPGLLGADQGELAGDPVEALRDRAAELLWAAYGVGGAARFVSVAGLPMPARLVACAGAAEIAVHGWDVAVARGDACPIPPVLAGRLLRLCPFLVAGREGLFARPVQVPAQASPCDKLVGYLGRDPASRGRQPGRPRLTPGTPSRWRALLPVSSIGA
jgi:uncharacterized protein (TIGR03086 family)